MAPRIVTTELDNKSYAMYYANLLFYLFIYLFIMPLLISLTDVRSHFSYRYLLTGFHTLPMAIGISYTVGLGLFVIRILIPVTHSKLLRHRIILFAPYKRAHIMCIFYVYNEM